MTRVLAELNRHKEGQPLHTGREELVCAPLPPGREHYAFCLGLFPFDAGSWARGPRRAAFVK
eukprot:1198184-Rhodomonas_salina.2